MSTNANPLQGRHRAPATSRIPLSSVTLLALLGGVVLLVALLVTLSLREGGLR